MKTRGSMTVFVALTFMLIASFLFALLEAGRVSILRQYTDMTSELAVESVFAEYQPQLWENYCLLGLDGAYGAESFSESYVAGVLGARVRENLVRQDEGGRMMKAAFVSAIPEKYQIMTDGEGRVFLYEVADYMKQNLPVEIVQGLYERYTLGQNVEDEYQIGDSIDNAVQTITEAREQETEGGKGRSISETASLQEQPEDSLGEVLTWKEKFVLGSVLENVEEVSIKGLEKEDCIENRVLQTGTWEKTPEIGWYEKILVTEYAQLHLSNYAQQKDERALLYELEYVIAGKGSDRENLEAVVERLMLIREAANMAHIMSDKEKKSMAMELAAAFVGFTGNAAIIKAVEYGVIGAWAYVESILDVRALLAGKTIAFMKEKEEWTSTLLNMTQFLEGSMQANACEDGWAYQDYLKSFLYVLTEKNLAYRMMDVIEKNIQENAAYRNFHMDNTLNAVTFELSYEAEPLFWDFSVLNIGKLKALQYQVTKSFSY